jgi:hypothetical protein
MLVSATITLNFISRAGTSSGRCRLSHVRRAQHRSPVMMGRVTESTVSGRTFQGIP